MSAKVYENGAWRDINQMNIYENGAWRNVNSAKVYENGAWREVYPALPTLNDTDAKIYTYKNKIYDVDNVRAENCTFTNESICPAYQDENTWNGGLFVEDSNKYWDSNGKSGYSFEYDYYHIYYKKDNNNALLHVYNTDNGLSGLWAAGIIASDLWHGYVDTDGRQDSGRFRLYNYRNTSFAYVYAIIGSDSTEPPWDGTMV